VKLQGFYLLLFYGRRDFLAPRRVVCDSEVMRFPKNLFCPLAFVFFITLAARADEQSVKWEKDIAAFEAKDKESPPPKHAVLFIGSSSIRLWKTLAEDFPKQQVINRGFGGSQIRDSLHFADRIVFPYEPRLIVMFVGGNDLNAKRTPQQVVDDFKAFVAKVREKLPDTLIDYISIPPAPVRWSQHEQIVEANNLISDFIKTDPKLKFIDIYSKELGDDGKPREELFKPDRLHPNEKGYALITSIVAPFLEKK
jgi:lysophospholipase L1-like esterase